MNWIAIIGLIFNTVGSILLAISLNRTLKMLDSSIKALELFKDTFLDKGDIVSLTGLDTHRENAIKKDKQRMAWGLIFLIIGFILQLIPSFLAAIKM